MMGFNCYYVCNYLSGVVCRLPGMPGHVVRLRPIRIHKHTHTLWYVRCVWCLPFIFRIDCHGLSPSQAYAKLQHRFPCILPIHHASFWKQKLEREENKRINKLNWITIFCKRIISQKSLSIFPFKCKEKDDWKALTAIQNKRTHNSADSNGNANKFMRIINKQIDHFLRA